MEVFDDLLGEYKKNRKGVVDGTDFPAEKNLFGEEQKLDPHILMEFVMDLLLINLMLSPVFWQFLENLNTAVFISFILLTQKSQYGN